MSGQIYKTAHIAHDDADEFFSILMKTIEEYQAAGLSVETQYHPVIQLNGKALHCILIHGRKL